MGEGLLHRAGIDAIYPHLSPAEERLAQMMGIAEKPQVRTKPLRKIRNEVVRIPLRKSVNRLATSKLFVPLCTRVEGGTLVLYAITARGPGCGLASNVVFVLSKGDEMPPGSARFIGSDYGLDGSLLLAFHVTKHAP